MRGGVNPATAFEWAKAPMSCSPPLPSTGHNKQARKRSQTVDGLPGYGFHLGLVNQPQDGNAFLLEQGENSGRGGGGLSRTPLGGNWGEEVLGAIFYGAKHCAALVSKYVAQPPAGGTDDFAVGLSQTRRRPTHHVGVASPSGSRRTRRWENGGGLWRERRLAVCDGDAPAPVIPLAGKMGPWDVPATVRRPPPAPWPHPHRIGLGNGWSRSVHPKFLPAHLPSGRSVRGADRRPSVPHMGPPALIYAGNGFKWGIDRRDRQKARVETLLLRHKLDLDSLPHLHPVYIYVF